MPLQCYSDIQATLTMEATKKIQEDLFQAIQVCNVYRVKEILSDHPELVDAERIGFDTSTPLMQACFYGRCSTDS